MDELRTVQLEVLIIENYKDLNILKNKTTSGVYMWTTKSKNKYIPYYIGETSNFENRFIEEFGLLLSGRWFGFDIDEDHGFLGVAKKANGKHEKDLHISKKQGLLLSGVSDSHSLFSDILDEYRIQSSLKMLRNTTWFIFLIHEKDPEQNKKIRKHLENQFILSYRDLAKDDKNDVPQLLFTKKNSTKSGNKKHFLGDWQNRTEDTSYIKINYKISNQTEIEKPDFEIIKKITEKRRPLVTDSP